MMNSIRMTMQRMVAFFLEPILRRETDRLSRQTQILLTQRYREMALSKPIVSGFDDVGFDVYSSSYEDGILLYIFSLIGTTNKKCVDIGAGRVNGSNSANLVVNHGFSAVLIDGNPENVKASRAYYRDHPETSLLPPTVVTAMVTAENINDLLRGNDAQGVIDLLCIDIDGVDYWIWKAIQVTQPRVVLVEYQDILGPDRSWTVPYSPNFNARDYPENVHNFNYCGASLKAFVKLGREKGYRLVGCSRGGWNAFFVSDDIDRDLLPEVTIESCFRYEWNHFGAKSRFPLVQKMEWIEV